MIRLALVLSLVLSSVSLAEDAKNGVAQVMVASPSTTYAGKKVSANEVLTTVGALRSGNEGGAKVKLAGNDVVVELAANSEINLVLPPSGDPSDAIELVKGKVRVRVPKPKPAKAGAKEEKPRFMLRHKKVTMGVRGTDFFASANDDLEETELVVFEGEVEFAKDKAPKETQRVAAGYWSANGGRFGDRIRPPMRLAPKGLSHYERLARDIPGFAIEAVPAEKSPEGSQTSKPGH